MMKNLLCGTLLLGSSLLWAEDITLLKMDDFSIKSSEQCLLKVESTATVRIEVRGGWDKSSSRILASGWILDRDTRKMLWGLSSRNAKSGRGRWDCHAEDEIALEPGIYEIYYAVSPLKYKAARKEPVGMILSELFGENSSRSWHRAAQGWGLRIRIKEADQKAVAVSDFKQEILQNISLAPMGDGDYGKIGFELADPREVRIYAMGEGTRRGMADYGWLVNADTFEPVWKMTYRKTDWAGGAEKNRMTDRKLTLTAGRYFLYYVTDDSHAFGSWNRLMPCDPFYYGVTLFPANDQKIRSFRTDSQQDPIADLTRAGNDMHLHTQFTVKHAVQVRVLCLGEMSRKRRLADYGWILDAGTREKIWQFSAQNCAHAGGDEKNQMAHAVLQLEPGMYEAAYVTDGSHAYPDWNAAPPFDPRAWGLCVWPAGSDFQPDWIETGVNACQEDILVQMIRIGEDVFAEERFDLSEGTSVRIYALGEGIDGDMYDFGWIEDISGRTVWRMDYRDTEHAGGGKKNRKINEVIDLPAGKYAVFYQSDGSHSYDDWNTDPPEDPVYWGITLRKEN